MKDEWELVRLRVVSCLCKCLRSEVVWCVYGSEGKLDSWSMEVKECRREVGAKVRLDYVGF